MRSWLRWSRLRGWCVVAGRLAGSLTLLAAIAAPPFVAAAGPQPEACTLLTGYSPPSGARPADAGQPTRVDSGETSACNFISDFPDSFGSAEVLSVTVNVTRYKPAPARPSVARAREMTTYQAQQERLASAAYGDLGFEGKLSGGPPSGVFHIFFTVHNYVGTVSSNGKLSSVAQAEARKLETVMKAAIGPPDDATAATQAGTLQLGLACAHDGIVLRCTASPSGAPAGADLTYAWTIDGKAQSATGSLLEVDLKAAGIAEGDHGIGVTARDTKSGQTASRSQAMTMSTTFAVRAPDCAVAEVTDGVELRCATSAVNAPAGADLVFEWTIDGRVTQGVASITKVADQGIHTVSVWARDPASGKQTAVQTITVAANPTGFLTNLLTGGQTSDPQNVVDEVAGSALGAAVIAAGAAVAGAIGAIGGIAAAGAAGGAAAPQAGGGTTPGPLDGGSTTARPVDGPGPTGSAGTGDVMDGALSLGDEVIVAGTTGLTPGDLPPPGFASEPAGGPAEGRPTPDATPAGEAKDPTGGPAAPATVPPSAGPAATTTAPAGGGIACSGGPPGVNAPAAGQPLSADVVEAADGLMTMIHEAVLTQPPASPASASQPASGGAPATTAPQDGGTAAPGTPPGGDGSSSGTVPTAAGEPDFDPEDVIADAAAGPPGLGPDATHWADTSTGPGVGEATIAGAKGSDRSGGNEDRLSYEGDSAAPDASGAYEALVVAQGARPAGEEPLIDQAEEQASQAERERERETGPEREGR